ncbi:MAG TPA: SDR family NAD(P)-dependent oxidoreductase [Gaiellaceae bacterium]|nr:SDR family NAD(P)-dependent oxidoreductase [Gaiellaceae bacterium]
MTVDGGRLQGKRAIISGAGMGMGRAAARRFAAEGARVGLLDLDEPAARAVAGEIEAEGGEALVLPADVRVEHQVEAAVRRAVAAWGGLDVVVANAGVELAGEDDRADRLDLAVWQRTLDVNLTGVFLVCKHGIRALLASGGGAVVCTASPTGLFGCAPGFDAYSASKAGVYGLTRVMAADYAREGIRVNAVIPGYTRTPMTEWVTPEEHGALLKTIPLGRQGEAEEVAAVMVFLASDEAAYVTGAAWAADGGMTAV